MRSIRALRALLAGAIVPLAMILSFVSFALTGALAGAGAASAAESTTIIHFTPEGLSALESQLRRHQVLALTFHPKPAPGHVHVSMADHTHYTVVYHGSAEQEHLIALAGAGGAHYAIAVSTAKPAKATHHTLRYVAGGILIVVIIVVAAVLLIDRRRKLNEGVGTGGTDVGTGGGDADTGGGDADTGGGDADTGGAGGPEG